MSNIKIKVGLHESGHGFQIVVDGPNMHKAYPEPVEDIREALGMVDTLRAMIEANCGIRLEDADILVSLRAVEGNAMTTESNRQAYRGMMCGRINPLK